MKAEHLLGAIQVTARELAASDDRIDRAICLTLRSIVARAERYEAIEDRVSHSTDPTKP
jgi:hypothetical protein